jgi:hypothetical protein
MNVDNYDNIWHTQIKPSLSVLEEERKKECKRRIGMGLVALSILFAVLLSKFAPDSSIMLPTAVFFVGIFVIFYYDNDYAKQFKKEIFKAVTKSSDIDWVINPRNADDQLLTNTNKELGTTSDKESGRIKLRDSKLYPDHLNILIDDVLMGKSYQKNIPVWEAALTLGSDNYKGVIFSGFFLEIPINHTFDGETYVRTKTDNNFDVEDSSFLGVGGNLKDVQMEWSDFFVVIVIEFFSFFRYLF